MDEPALKTSLPKEHIVEVLGMEIGMVHIAGPAAGREARLVRRFPDCAAIVYGHTHVPQAEHWQGVWILNPGSPTERRKAPSRAMLELRVRPNRILPSLIQFGA
jgi:predicted phosphodiesterase